MSTDKLPAERLIRRCDPDSLGFQHTGELDRNQPIIGQDRAVEALQFGLAMDRAGFNVFVLGATGSGRARLAQVLVESHAAQKPVPLDWCYVHNFEDPRKPRALGLPPGQGARLRDQMERLTDDLVTTIPGLFEGQRYRESREAIENEVNHRYEAEVESIVAAARERGVAVMRTPGGFVLAPMADGKVLDQEQQKQLQPEERERLAKEAEAVHGRLHDALSLLPQIQREQRQRIKQMEQDIVRATVAELLAEPRRAFGQLSEILQHLDAVERDIVDNASQVIRALTGAQSEGVLPMAIDGTLFREGPFLRRYRVNVMVDHRLSQGAPVVRVDHPTSGNLVGKVEHLSQLGILVTDFNLIKPGALHKANGGYLLIDARRLLMQPASYDQLKRILRSGEIRIESVAEALDLAQTLSQEPEPIPFKAKIVLIGERWLYHRLCALDPEFEELFKVPAEFESTLDRNAESSRRYASMLAHVLDRQRLRPMDAAAVARVIEHAARLAGDGSKLSMHVRDIFDLLAEADHWARTDNRERVVRQDVDRAIQLRRHRTGRTRELVQEWIAKRTLRIDTRGRRIGQINALSVIPLGQAAFGHPSRVTARVRLGKGEVIAIDREVDMGGPIHNKGVLILSGLLGGRYLPDKPSSLRATLVFEQTYGTIDGDSASLAELLALLSALGELPLAQGIAVTGAIDQLGQVQAVGGINEKIEGFFDACAAHGLNGEQGLIIPRANQPNLMLDSRVLEAAQRDRFHVWTVDDVDGALSIMTGLPAGERDPSGGFPVDSANGRIEARLEALARSAREHARAGRGEDTP